MLIKAGTYTFNETLTLYDFTNAEYDSFGFLYYSFNIPFNVTVTDGVESMSLDFTKIILNRKRNEYNTMNMWYGTDDNFAVFYSNGKWNFNSETYPLDYFKQLRSINVVEDTEVDDTFGAWFELNIQPVLRKFTRLFLGDIAYSSNGKRWRALQP